MATVHFHNETLLTQVYHEPQTALPFTLAPGESRDIEVPDEPYFPFLLANGGQELKGDLPVAAGVKIDGKDVSALEGGGGGPILDYQFLPCDWFIDGSVPPDSAEDLGSTISVRKFAGDAENDVLIPWQVPKDLSPTTQIKFRVIFFITELTAPNNEGVVFGLTGVSLGDGDALSSAHGAAVVVATTGMSHAQNDRVASAWSDPVTVADLAVGETVVFRLYRDHDHVSDTYVQKVGVAGIEIQCSRVLEAGI